MSEDTSEMNIKGGNGGEEVTEREHEWILKV